MGTELAKRILSVLESAEGPLKTPEIARKLGFNKSSDVNPTLYNLEKKQLTERVRESPPTWALIQPADGYPSSNQTARFQQDGYHITSERIPAVSYHQPGSGCQDPTVMSGGFQQNPYQFNSERMAAAASHDPTSGHDGFRDSAIMSSSRVSNDMFTLSDTIKTENPADDMEVCGGGGAEPSLIRHTVTAASTSIAASNAGGQDNPFLFSIAKSAMQAGGHLQSEALDMETGVEPPSSPISLSKYERDILEALTRFSAGACSVDELKTKFMNLENCNVLFHLNMMEPKGYVTNVNRDNNLWCITDMGRSVIGQGNVSQQQIGYIKQEPKDMVQETSATLPSGGNIHTLSSPLNQQQNHTFGNVTQPRTFQPPMSPMALIRNSPDLYRANSSQMNVRVPLMGSSNHIMSSSRFPAPIGSSNRPPSRPLLPRLTVAHNAYPSDPVRPLGHRFSLRSPASSINTNFSQFSTSTPSSTLVRFTGNSAQEPIRSPVTVNMIKHEGAVSMPTTVSRGCSDIAAGGSDAALLDSLNSNSFAALNKNPVSALMEYAQANKTTATIENIGSYGPSHNPK